MGQILNIGLAFVQLSFLFKINHFLEIWHFCFCSIFQLLLFSNEYRGKIWWLTDNYGVKYGGQQDGGDVKIWRTYNYGVKYGGQPDGGGVKCLWHTIVGVKSQKLVKMQRTDHCGVKCDGRTDHYGVKCDGQTDHCGVKCDGQTNVG